MRVSPQERTATRPERRRTFWRPSAELPLSSATVDRQEGSSRRTWWITACVVVLAGVALVGHCQYYMPFLADDALISLRYSQRLLEGQGLTWTDGQPVEGYSNLLWVLLSAGLGYLGIDLVTSVRILGYVSAGMVLAAIGFCYQAATVRGVLPSLVGLLTFVLAAPVAIWTIGGLESILVAGLLTCALTACYPIVDRGDVSVKHSLLASVFLAFLCINRPDGALFTVAVVAAMVLLKGVRWKTFRIAVLLAALPVAFYLGQLVFRLAYYGELVPNTALVKISGSLAHLRTGTSYIVKGLLWLSPVSELAIFAAVYLLVRSRDRTTWARIVLVTVAAVAWAGYMASVGGDFFPGWRHVVPLIPLMALVLAEATRWRQRHAGVQRSGLLITALLIGVFAPYYLIQDRSELNHRATTERWPWHGQVVGQMLNRGFAASQPLLAVDCAGCLPYWSKLPALDMLGLTDHYLPRHPPEDFGRGMLAHELGDGDYVLRCEPDLIIFTVPEGREKACWRSGRQMQAKPEFYELYTLCTFEGREPYPYRSRVWVRTESDKIGLNRSEAGVRVPAYLLNGNCETIAYLDRSDHFVVAASAAQPAVVRGLGLPPGRWQVDVEADRPVEAAVRRAGDSAELLAAGVQAEFTIAGRQRQRIDVVLKPEGAAGVEVRGVRFTRCR